MAVSLTIRPGHPDFLDLPWAVPLTEWELENLLDLPKGISRHEVRFLSYPAGIYVVKELPSRPARNDYSVLRTLESAGAPAVTAIGLVDGRVDEPTEERAAALITAYEPFSFSYREMLAGPGFGPRRNQMLDAFAGLLVELHLARCFWGDCSLSNVLYRFDAEAIETIMVDAETAEVFDEDLTKGRREHDLEIMIENVAGGMSDIAAEMGADLDAADLDLGLDIAERYRNLWSELKRPERIRANETFRIKERIDRVNLLGFDVREVDLIPSADDTAELMIKIKLGGRNFHANRLQSLTGIEALDNQARAILSDVHYHSVNQSAGSTTGKDTAAVRWRVRVFEPLLAQLRSLPGIIDPIQAYCDLLNHRYLMASRLGRDVSNEEAMTDWIDHGRPGYPLD